MGKCLIFVFSTVALFFKRNILNKFVFFFFFLYCCLSTLYFGHLHAASFSNIRNAKLKKTHVNYVVLKINVKFKLFARRKFTQLHDAKSGFGYNQNEF